MAVPGHLTALKPVFLSNRVGYYIAFSVAAPGHLTSFKQVFLSNRVGYYLAFNVAAPSHLTSLKLVFLLNRVAHCTRSIHKETGPFWARQRLVGFSWLMNLVHSYRSISFLACEGVSRYSLLPPCPETQDRFGALSYTLFLIPQKLRIPTNQ